MREFKKGVVVELKTGGIQMTCANTPSSLVEHVRCQWFSGSNLDKLECGEFPQESLVIVDLPRAREYSEAEALEAKRLASMMLDGDKPATALPQVGQCEHTAPAEPAVEQQASDRTAATPDPEHP
jgi:uncharacterized protein YodC (DUF2158 family)